MYTVNLPCWHHKKKTTQTPVGGSDSDVRNKQYEEKSTRDKTSTVLYHNTKLISLRAPSSHARETKLKLLSQAL